jgi:hypothetical protein
MTYIPRQAQTTPQQKLDQAQVIKRIMDRLAYIADCRVTIADCRVTMAEHSNDMTFDDKYWKADVVRAKNQIRRVEQEIRDLALELPFGCRSEIRGLINSMTNAVDYRHGDPTIADL